MRSEVMDLLFLGVGWASLAMTLNRIAVGAFFMLSGYKKLFNAERHQAITEELKALGVPAIGFNQWWVPSVEILRGRRRPFRAVRAARGAWPACHHRRRDGDVRTAADQALQADG